MFETMSDEQLVALSQQGNTRAFNSLTSRWESSLYRFALRTLGNPDDARDVCQEALLKAYVNIKRLRDGQKFKSWAHHIVLNLCRDKFRSASARNEAATYDEDEDGEGRAAMLEASLGAAHHGQETSVRRLLESALSRISDEQRTAILLREFHGFTSEEIAEITGVPAATVRSRIFYGLKSMRRLLQDGATA